MVRRTGMNLQYVLLMKERMIFGKCIFKKYIVEYNYAVTIDMSMNDKLVS